jgi:integrase
MLITAFKMKFVQHWIDHLGRKRYRVRRQKKILGELPVNGDPSSPEFQAAYHAILRGDKAAAAADIATRSGSVKDALERYFISTTFNDGYEQSTRNLRRCHLNSVGRLVGNLPLTQMNRKWIEGWLETAPTEGVKRTRFLAVRPFLQWAHEKMHLIDSDPTVGMKVKGAKEGQGHATWSDEEIAQYRATHPIGTMARLALELILAVAGRRGDAIALGRRHLKDGWLIFTQEKNRKRKPVTVQCPAPAELMAALEACPSPQTSLTFLTNEWGRPFAHKGFGDWFRAQTDAAGLGEHCVPHGLRKAACRIMAENDCTAHEIKSVSGHRTLREVERYTDAVNNRRLAAQAKAKVARRNNVVPLAVA